MKKSKYKILAKIATAIVIIVLYILIGVLGRTTFDQPIREIIRLYPYWAAFGALIFTIVMFALPFGALRLVCSAIDDSFKEDDIDSDSSTQ